MLLIFLYSALIILFTAPYSLFINSQNKFNIYSYSKSIIFGIIFISFIAILINFFFPLNIYVCTLIPLISLIIIFKNKNIFFNLNFYKFLIIQSFFLTVLLTESNVYRPDAGLYHLPYIGILNAEKIIFGISNLHTRYSLTSIQQYFSAINNNLIFENNGIVFAQALIGSSVIINFLSQINSYIKKKNLNFHFFYLFFVIIFVAYKMNRYGEYGNDAPAHFLVFFLVSEILLIKNFNMKDYGNNLILSLFIVQSKLTLIFIVLLNLINFNKIKFKIFILDKRFIFTTLFFTIWLTKNIISSGCLLYPIKLTCFNELSWTKIETVNKVSVSAEAWTKGWSNKDQKFEITQKNFIKNFEWVGSWSNVHFKLILKILIPYLVFCLLFFIILKIKYKNKTSYSFPKEFKYYFLILLICSLIWFLKSPLFRYGYSFLICTIAFMFSYFCVKINLPEEKKNYLISSILILCITVFIGKNLVRIVKKDNNYNNYPWPKYYSMDENNILANFKEKKFGNTIIITPINGYCMYVKKICSHYEIPKNLKVKNKYNYLIFK